MTEDRIFECPGCDNKISINGDALMDVGRFGVVGCMNEEDHDDGEPLVMYEEEGEDA